VAEPGAVGEFPAHRAAEETRRLEALVETIFGTLVVAVPAGVPTLGPAVEPGLAMGGARDLVRAMGPDPALAQELEVVELVPGLDGAAVPGRGTEPDRVVEAGRDSGRAAEPAPNLDPVVLGRGAERDRVVEAGRDSGREAVRVQAPEPSLP